MKPLITPSILSADFARLGEEVDAVLFAGGDMIHLDVMDHHYVPALTFGPIICGALRHYGVTAPLDVHLMVEPVDEFIREFSDAGASQISFHPEASKHVDRSLSLIRSHNIMAGLALNPATPLHVLDHVWERLDFVLVMSVNPGFAAQSFIPETLEKIKMLREKINLINPSIRLAVDGGVKIDNIKAISEAGADTFIMGSAIFDSDDYASVIAKARSLL